MWNVPLVALKKYYCDASTFLTSFTFSAEDHPLYPHKIFRKLFLVPGFREIIPSLQGRMLLNSI